MKKYFEYIFLPIICILTVLTPIKVYANSIYINKSNMTLGIGISERIQYTLGENLSSNDIVWTSSNPEVATVDNGIVTALTEGVTIITASINDLQSTCKITVTSNYIKVTDIKLNKSNTTLLIGSTENLKATISPSDATSENIAWTSSNPEVATISSSGKITAKSVGSTIITASINGYNATCKVTVVYSMSLKGISLNKTNITLKENKTMQLSVIYNPTNATNQKVTWKSSNKNVATVSASGLVTAKKKGTATITVVSNDGGYLATCKVIVEEISKKVTGIKLDKTELNMLSGETEKLKATITPDYAENKNIIWTSSDEKIATVKDGEIKALYPGTVEIKATSEDGKKEAICKVIITSPPIESINFSQTEQTIYVGDEILLNFITNPETAVLENPIWSSTNINIATVEEGKVKALSKGEVTITVSNKEGTISASTKIIVIEQPKAPLNIIIEGYNLNFDPNILNYKLKIGNETELKITTNVDQNDIIIKGNQNLTKGSIITITYAEEPSKVYIINIQKKANYTIYFIAIISVLLLLNLIRIVIKSKKKSKY